MNRYTASITHDIDSINSFTKAQFNIYKAKERRLLLAIGAAFLVGGVLVGTNKPIGIILLFLGCILYVRVANIPRQTAKKIMQLTKEFKPIDYFFDEENILVIQDKKQAKIEYSAIETICDDAKFVSLFSNENTAYTFSKKSINPYDIAGFKKFIAEKTGRSWRPVNAVYSFNLKNLIDRIKAEPDRR